MLELNKTYLCDCVEGMSWLEPESIDLTVTSPPYDSLRLYSGYTFPFEEIAKELYRVTKVGGVVVWVVGDQVIDGSESGTSFRQALYFKDTCGFRLHDTMLYEKNSAAYPASAKSTRYSQVFEYVFIFSKGTPKTHTLIKDKPNRWAGTTNFGRGSSRMIDGSLKIGKKHVINDVGYRNNIWRINKGFGYTTKDKIAFTHPAMFPELLAEGHILTWSKEDDTVLDPMMGAGTVAKMAIKNNRNYIGFEVSQEYCDIIRIRLEENFGPGDYIGHIEWH